VRLSYSWRAVRLQLVAGRLTLFTTPFVLLEELSLALLSVFLLLRGLGALNLERVVGV
jgi:hypothetical protein